MAHHFISYINVYQLCYIPQTNITLNVICNQKFKTFLKIRSCHPSAFHCTWNKTQTHYHGSQSSTLSPLCLLIVPYFLLLLPFSPYCSHIMIIAPLNSLRQLLPQDYYSYWFFSVLAPYHHCRSLSKHNFSEGSLTTLNFLPPSAISICQFYHHHDTFLLFPLMFSQHLAHRRCLLNVT